MPPEKLVMMEDHDKAYHAWKERGIRDMTLVHVDAHIDFGWVPELDLNEIGADAREGALLNPFLLSRTKMVTIGNYICPAMREGMVKKFYWVVPDKSLSDPRGTKHILAQLGQLLRIKRFSGGKPRLRDGRIHCSVFGKELVVCTLESLERLQGPVLLDIDVDFMLTPAVWDDLDPRRFPWIFPEELLEKLGRKIDGVELMTIAYSVEGGYTPLRFKYLGDELRSLAAGIVPKTMSHKRSALAHEKGNRPEQARQKYEEALGLDDRDASSYYNLFLLHMGARPDVQSAARYYNGAVARDRSYSTSYNNYGMLYLRHNQPRKAEVEYRKFLEVDANNAAALNGLGYIFLGAGRYRKASEFFGRCLAQEKGHAGARAGRAIAAFKQGALVEAHELFSRLTEDRPDDAEAYWWRGRIAQRKGELSGAIDNYKSSVMRGGEGPLVHFLLAGLYLRKGFYYRAREEFQRFFQAWRMAA